MNMFKSTVALVSIVLFCSSIAVNAKPLQPNSNSINTILAKLESPSEDMLDAIDVKNVTQLKQLYSDLNSLMLQLNNINTGGNVQSDEMMRIALLNSWFSLISLELKEMDDFPALANAVNQFSGQLIITTKFNNPYQKDIAWMDYLGRELVLMNKNHSDTKDNSLINTRKSQLDITWKRVQKSIKKDSQGFKLIKKVNPVIQRLLHEKSAKKAKNLAEQELELVDNIEAYFNID